MQIRFLISLFFFLPVVTVLSQTSINSPYSRYGLGELNFDKSAYITSLSGTSSAFRKNNIINYTNPASYSSLQKQSFLFDAGALFYPKILKNDVTSEQTLFAGLNNIQFAFPVLPKWGVSFGVFPYSTIGYKLKDEEEIDSIGLVKYSYDGWGGLNTLYFGSGIEIFKGLSFGVNGEYYFGNITRRRVAVVDTIGFTNTRIRNRVNVSDLGMSIGLQYQIRFNRKVVSDETVSKEFSGYSLILGMNASNKTNLNTRESILADHISGTSPDAVSRDTVKFIDDIRSEIVLPLHISSGFFLEKENRWLAGADIQWQKWSDFSFQGIDDSLKNSLRISFGGALFAKDKPTMNMLKRTTVLFGFHYYSNYLELRNTPITQYGISFGLSMPVRRTGTALNISFEIGQAGSTTNNLIEETYGKLKIGVSISEKWFYRSKYE